TFRSFYAFEVSFSGGVFVGAVEGDGDGKTGVIAGRGSGLPEVHVYSGATGELRLDFEAPVFEPPSPQIAPLASGVDANGVRVAGIDLRGSQRGRIIPLPGTGQRPLLGVAEIVVQGSAVSVAEIDRLFAFDESFLGSGFVAAG